jgi:hypothetical protein
MSFRKLALPSGSVTIQDAHSKVTDYSKNRIKELGGVPVDLMVKYSGGECIAVIDTETTCETGDNFGQPLIYDVGVTFVLKSTGDPVGKADFIITDTFCNAKLMKGAFFTNRVFTDYPHILAENIANLCNFETMLKQMQQLFLHYNVSTFAAYNSSFDTRAFDKTASYLERINPEKTYHFGLVSDIRNGTIDVLDLWALSCMTFMNQCRSSKQLYSWF